MAGIVSPGAHGPGRDIEKVARIRRAVGQARAEPTGTVDQEQAQGPMGVAQQLAGEQGAAESRADDGDHRGGIRRCHRWGRLLPIAVRR
jgi:hypothetical protein